MKTLFAVMFVFIASIASAQIVNIPDPEFKQALLNYSPVIDINGNGEIEVAEATAVTELNLYLSASDLTGIRAFANLRTLTFLNSILTNIDVSDMAELRSINFQGNNAFTSVNISGCSNLEYANVSGGGPFITNLVIGSLPRLKYLALSLLQLADLDLRGCDSLSTLKFELFSDIGILNVSGLNQLDSIYDFGSIGSLIATNCTALEVIKTTSLGIDNILDVTGCINLREIVMPELGAYTLDLSTCPNLRDFVVQSSSMNLQYLNLKNGSQLVNFGFLSQWFINPTLSICADDFEINTVIQQLGIPISNTLINVSSYCSFFPAGTYNTIKGQIILDQNNNSCDISDPRMGNVPISITDTSGNSVIRYTGASGNYAHYPYKGVFTLTPSFPFPYFNIAPISANVIFDTANSIIDTVDFCISANGLHNDLDITFLPAGAARPGFDATYVMVYKNRGTTNLSGSVQLNFDNSKMNFVSASAGVSSQSAGQRTWNFNNILPFERRTLYVTFNILPPPVNNINDTLIYLASINPAVNDETPGDNNFVLPQRVIGSYDPNDKLCLEGSKIAFTDIDKPLNYIIHFQNLGTDTAFNIVVADTLSNKLDWNSFEFTGSSHTCNVQQRNGKMEFFFQNINLPHSSVNEPASHGFVAFKIKPKADVIIGDSINNRAAIYFDFNPPVITNMATTVVSPVGPVPVRLEYFSAAAKGNTNILNWKASCSNGSSTFNIERSTDGIHFMKIGNITATHTRCQLPFNYIDEQPLTGKNFYRIKITDPDGISFYSKVLVVGNNKQDLEIVAIGVDRDNTLIYLDASKQQIIQLKIIAADGKLIYSSRKIIPAGRSQTNVRLKGIASGIYSLIVNNDRGEIISKRFVK